MVKLISIIALCIYVGSSCTDIACGELSGEWKNKYSQAKERYKQIGKLENIPCEFTYIDFRLSNVGVDSAIINDLHKDIYDQKSKIGWAVIKVYDKNGQYLYSHSYNNSTYKQTGD